jgi:hypothetical protein
MKDLLIFTLLYEITDLFAALVPYLRIELLVMGLCRLLAALLASFFYRHPTSFLLHHSITEQNSLNISIKLLDEKNWRIAGISHY